MSSNAHHPLNLPPQPASAAGNRAVDEMMTSQKKKNTRHTICDTQSVTQNLWHTASASRLFACLHMCKGRGFIGTDCVCAKWTTAGQYKLGEAHRDQLWLQPGAICMSHTHNQFLCAIPMCHSCDHFYELKPIANHLWLLAAIPC